MTAWNSEQTRLLEAIGVSLWRLADRSAQTIQLTDLGLGEKLYRAITRAAGSVDVTDLQIDISDLNNADARRQLWRILRSLRRQSM